MEENVIWLQIPMHNIILVEDLKSLKKLFEDQEGLFLVQSVLFSKKAFKSATIAVFVNKIKVILGF